jgi:hypothetical protein
VPSQIPNINIQTNVQQFLKDRNGFLRYASFDYCFNYFQSFRENNIAELASDGHIHESCLQLGFYLASWGMFRGSSFLLNRSVKHFENTIRLIAGFDPIIWSIDVEGYSKENIKILVKFKECLIESLGENNKPSDTLVTKIMLGVFGNTPAFDTNFSTAFHSWTLCERSLKKVANFYNQNRDRIDNYDIHTIDIMTGGETARKYTTAKIIDMIGFIEGQRIPPPKKKK